MPQNDMVAGYRRRVTSIERFFARAPYATITMVARIRGSVSESRLRAAISKVRQRHTNLRIRIVEDEQGAAWFASERAGDIPVQIVPRESDDHWITVVQEANQLPYEFDARPAVRFLLVQSPAASDLIILCHHILCDGLSLAYLATDLMHHLGDPTRKVEVLPDPVPLDRDTIPEGVTLSPVVKFLVRRMNTRWERERIVFDQQDYADLNEAYWQRYNHRMLCEELSEGQTSALVENCRSEGVTVNSALAAAFLGAQTLVQPDRAPHPTVSIAASLRDRLRTPAGQAMGFYAGMVMPKLQYNPSRRFWDNARAFHRKVRPLFTDRNLFKDPLTWCYLDPALLEAIHFKKVGGLVPPHAASYEKLSAFSGRDDVILAILKRDKMDSLDRITLGTGLTNLGRLDFPRQYGELELDRLIMKPGGGFPLANVSLLLGAVTCAGKLSLVLEFVEANLELAAAEAIQDKALRFLLDEPRS